MNSPFPSCLLSLCQKEPSCETIDVKMCFLSCNSISSEGFCASTRLDIEAQRNKNLSPRI